MRTYQDLEKLGQDEYARQSFIRTVINEHKCSTFYKIAKIGDDYDRQQNTTITNYRKVIYNLKGLPVEDVWTANYKLPSGFFKRFVSQECQYLLGNGVTWKNPSTEKKLGIDFDTRLQEAARAALVGGCAYGFWNKDRLNVFKVTEFAPLYNEENGALMAGVRYWQLDDTKPLRATFYEQDGYTEYMWEEGECKVLREKRPYILKVRYSEADGMEIYDGENYPSFPIVPLWGNPHHQSEILGVRAKIDAYDLIESGFANDLDNAQIYWVLHNTGGMDDVDLAQFIERLHITHAASVDDTAGTAVDAHTVDIPHEGREKLLDRLESDLYKDYMALNTEKIAGGAVTATQVKAAYEPLNSKTDEFEYCVIDFIQGILNVAGIDDEPSFTRSVMINTQEEVQTLVQAAQYLDESYITEKVLNVLGDGDKADEMLAQIDADELRRGEVIAEPEETEV